MVRSFFDAFSHGVIESQMEDRNEKTTPQSVKKLMLEHYEHIAPAFFDTMFFPLAAMNYKYEDIAALAREAQQRGDDMMALVRTACGDEAYYNAMVEEYKRNFSMLLAGRYLSNADHLEGYVRKAEEVTEALGVLGDEYTDTFSEIFESGHVDVYPTDTKTTGAFEVDAGEGYLPWILFNYNGYSSDVSTIAHEGGHAVYSAFTIDNQDEIYEENTIFTHEVASMTNELL